MVVVQMRFNVEKKQPQRPSSMSDFELQEGVYPRHDAMVIPGISFSLSLLFRSAAGFPLSTVPLASM